MLHFSELISKKTRDLSFLSKYFLSFCLVFMIPLIFLGSVIFYYLNHVIRQYTVSDYKNTVKSIDYTINSQFDQLTAISILMMQQKIFYSYYISNHVTAYIDINSRLVEFKNMNQFIDDTCLYHTKDGNLFGTLVTADIKTYLDIYYNACSEDINDLVASISNSQDSFFYTLRTKKEKKKLLYLRPIDYHATSGSRKVNTWAIFIIDYKNIEKILNPLITGAFKNSEIFLCNFNKCFYTYGNTVDISQFYKLIDPLSETNPVVSIDSKEYVAFADLSQLGAISVHCLVPKERIYIGFNRFIVIAVLAGGISILFGALAMFLLTSYNYTPIKKILSSVIALTGDGDINQNAGKQVKLTSNNMDLIITDINKSNVVMNRYRDQKILFKIIEHSYSNESYVKSQFPKLDTQFSFVCIIDYGTSAGYDLNIVDKYCLGENIYYIMEYSEHNNLIVICSYNKKPMKKNEAIRELMRVLCIDFSSCNIGYGCEVASISDIHTSYLAARKAVSYAKLYNKTETDFSEIQSLKITEHKYPKEEIDSLYGSVINADFEKINLSVIEISNYLLEFNTFISCLLTVSDAINRTLSALNTLTNSNYTLSSIMPDVNTEYLLNFNSVSHLTTFFQEAIKSITAQLKKHPLEEKKDEATNSDKDMDKILLFINNNYNNSNFSVNLVASEFGMSISNFSHYFKSHTYQNVSAYINTLRMDRAVYLLVNTDKSIAEIVNEVGYFHTSGFIKKFKLIYGTTPGEYRKKMKEVPSGDLNT